RHAEQSIERHRSLHVADDDVDLPKRDRRASLRHDRQGSSVAAISTRPRRDRGRRRALEKALRGRSGATMAGPRRNEEEPAGTTPFRFAPNEAFPSAEAIRRA